jgi:FKBP-type peptidyl-prolyl cis-trans isomerase SlpA
MTSVTASARVRPDSFLTLHYRLAGPKGDLINTFAGKPAKLSLCTGAMSKAKEQRLLGLSDGARAVFEIPAGEAFGQRNPAMLQWVARGLLAEQGDPEAQYRVGEVVEFPAPDGLGQYAGAVREVRDDGGGGAVLFDFNHPLAGQPVTFEVHLIGVL